MEPAEGPAKAEHEEGSGIASEPHPSLTLHVSTPLLGRHSTTEEACVTTHTYR